MKFSIIVPHYDGSISDIVFERGIKCLLNQTLQDFEVLIYHDGPISRPIPDIWKSFGERAKLTITKIRQNDWGHSNRDRGIKEARGEYIIHFNPDNILYSNAIDQLSKTILEEERCNINNALIPSAIVVFPIIMRGMRCNGKMLWRNAKNVNRDYMIFTGYPPIKNNIDCMQLVMRTDLWRHFGGWKDKSVDSDGNMYPYFISQFGAKYCSEVLGEHW